MRSSYLKWGFGFLLVALCLGVPHGQATAGGTASYRLLYLFDPAVESHAARAAELGDLIRTRSQAVGIVRAEVTPDSELPFEIHTVAEAVKEEGGFPALSQDARLWLSRVAEKTGDFVAIDNGAALERAASGEEFSQVLGAFLGQRRSAISTEVDFSTWGKVKELFR